MGTSTKEKPFARRMREAREAADLSLSDVEHELRNRMGEEAKSLETVRRLETGVRSEGDANPLLLYVLSQIYGCDLKQLSPQAVPAVERWKKMFGNDQSGWIGLQQTLLAAS